MAENPAPAQPTEQPLCFRCQKPARRTCALCGQPFCRDHGADRWVWKEKIDGFQVGQTEQMKMEVCGQCLPMPTLRKWMLPIAVILVAAVAFLVYYRSH